MRTPLFFERSRHYSLPVSKDYNKQEWLPGGLPLSKHVLLSYDPKDSHWELLLLWSIFALKAGINGKMSIKKLTGDSLLSSLLLSSSSHNFIQFDFDHVHFKCTHFWKQFANFTNQKLFSAPWNVTCTVVPPFKYWKYYILCFRLGIVYNNKVKFMNLSWFATFTLCMYATFVTLSRMYVQQ